MAILLFYIFREIWREGKRERRFTGREGLLNPIHSGHHVSSERGKEASFSSQQRKSKDQITRCCSRKLALCAEAGAATTRTRTGEDTQTAAYLGARVSPSPVAITILQGRLMLLCLLYSLLKKKGQYAKTFLLLDLGSAIVYIPKIISSGLWFNAHFADRFIFL